MFWNLAQCLGERGGFCGGGIERLLPFTCRSIPCATQKSVSQQGARVMLIFLGKRVGNPGGPRPRFYTATLTSLVLQRLIGSAANVCS
jgi:hypothetical protein